MTNASGTEVANENVLIRAGNCSVTIFPHLGGKIASIRVKDRELLQAPIAAYGPRTRTMPFDAGDASGWDECLPSVACCTVETAAGEVTIPDHGDLWRIQWAEVKNQESELAGANSATFCGECFSLPLSLERSVALAETESGWRLSLDYTLTNTGDCSVPWSWSAHPLFTAEDEDRIILPSSIHELRLEGSGGGRLQNSGDPIAWPIARLARGGETDLSVAQSAESEIGDKLFAGPLTATENWCTLVRPKAGVRITMSFNPEATPYLGLWICYGGWPERPGPKQMCVAPEPATSPVDSLAQTGPWSRILNPGESYSWPMSVEIESI